MVPAWKLFPSFPPTPKPYPIFENFHLSLFIEGFYLTKNQDTQREFHTDIPDQDNTFLKEILKICYTTEWNFTTI